MFLKTFRETCLNTYKLDPAHFYTAPGLAWQACLKKTGIELDLLSDMEMLLFVEQGIQRWSMSSCPYDMSKLTINIWVINI